MSKLIKKALTVLTSLAAAASVTASLAVYADMTPNPVISRNCPAYDLSGESYSAKQGNDEHYFSFWNASTPNYLAYDLSEVPEEQRRTVMAVWYNTSSYDSIGQYQSRNMEPFSYTIEVNKAPGGEFPVDGWETAVSVDDNTLSSRQHVVDMSGYNWIRMNVASSDGGTGSNVSINFDVHDISDGISDSWLFLGDSITAGGMNNCYGTGFATYVNQLDRRYFPIQENGGIGGIRSVDGRENIDRWLSVYSGKYVSIAYGTNDAWGNDGSGAEAYYENTKYMIDAVLAAEKIPVLPKIPYSTNADVNTHLDDFNGMIDRLYKEYDDRLIQGPDFETYFRENPDGLSSDGVHPSSEGYDAMRQIWAKEMYEKVYKTEPEDMSALEYLSYEKNEEGSISITGCFEDYKGAMYIPSQIDGIPVEYIEGNAFENCIGLTSVELGKGIKIIEGYAFNGCTSLTSVKIPDSLTAINGRAFYGCSAMEEFTIPAGFNGNLDEAFIDVDNLKAINVEDGNKRYMSVNGILYGCRYFDSNFIKENEITELVAVPSAYETDNLIIPEGIKTTAHGALYECSKVTGITFPDSMEYFDCQSYLCSLNSMEIGIKKLHITKKLRVPEELAVMCPYLEEITVDSENDKYTLIDGVLYNKDVTYVACYPPKKAAVKLYEVPDTVTKLFRYGMYNANVEEIILPESVANLDIEAIVTPSLKRITIMNPDCEILGNKAVANNMKGEYSGVICGYEGSTAQKYAERFGFEFESLGSGTNTLYGDADCDGQVFLNDAVLVMQAIGNPDAYGVEGSDPSHITEEGKINADVSGNSDGLTNMDALVIQKYIIHLIDELPE